MYVGWRSRRGRTLNKLPALSQSTTRKRTPWRRFRNACLVPVVTGIVWLWCSTFRVRFEYEDGASTEADPKEPRVFATWHEQLLCSFPFLIGELRKQRHLVTLISPSVDGDIATDVAGRYGLDVVRGSATRSGFAALRSLLSATRTLGASAFVVTDGPKGPARQSKGGSLMLAKMSASELVPLVCVSSRESRFPSWDRLRLPWPFAKIVILIGSPEPSLSDSEDASVEQAARRLDAHLERLTVEAERLAR